MPRSFPSVCLPYEWDGDTAVAARRFQDHGFQDLVASVVFSELQAQAKLPGPGPDGKIDLWIEPGPKSSGFFLGPYPAIVECKYHGDGDWPSLRDRWAALYRDLRAVAAAGWEGREKPWLLAKTYIYCISASVTTDTRLQLESQIRKDLAKLDRGDGSTFADVRVQVITWAELRRWADRFPSVCDAWLGSSSARILPRAKYIAQFGEDDFRRWLRDDLLPFVEPSKGAAFHPSKIVDLLQQQMSKGGVILHGPGGVGKTRTAVEVGAIVAAGPFHWRVLHVNVGEDGVTVDELIREISPSSEETTLVVYDYLDQATNFVPDVFARTLFADYPTARVVLLGTARHARIPRAAQHAFVPVNMYPDERHVDRVLTRIREAFAPELHAAFSDGTLESIGGRRPVIALLIYEELTRRLHQSPGDVAHLREALSLKLWLEGRLRDATQFSGPGIVEPEQERWAKQIAAASVFAAAPQSERELIAVANAALRSAGCESAVLAERIVKKLSELGWLVRYGDELTPAHDVITEELLEGALLAEDGSIFPTALESVLAPALTSSRTLGRMALSFGRLIGDQLRDREAEPQLRRVVSRWFEQHAASIGALLGSSGEAGRDAASYAVGAVLSSRAWSVPLLARWDAVVAPWLDAQENVPEMRHLLYRALQSADTTSALERNLLRQAIDWLHANYERPEASFLAVQVLDRLDVAEIEPIAKKLVVWLLQHCQSGDARYVIMAVLRRPELSSELRDAARDAAERWLETGTNSLDAAAPALFRQFVKSGPETRQLARTRRRLMDVHFERAKTSDCRDTDSLRFLAELAASGTHDDVTQTLALVRQALEHDLEPRRAARLLTSVLRLRALRAISTEIIPRAIALDVSSLSPSEAAQLLEALLAAAAGDDLHEAIGKACAWLQAHRRDAEAGPVLGTLLRIPLGTREREVVRAAARWLPLHIQSADAGLVLPPLLRSDVLDDRARTVVSHALEWIHRYIRQPQAQYTIEEILKQDGISQKLRQRFARLAFDRFLELGHIPGMSYVGVWLTEHLQDLPRWQRRRFVEVATEWVEAHGDDGEREYVANALLKSNEIPNDDWGRVAAVSLAILRRGHPEPGFSIAALATRPSLLSDDDLDFLRELVDRPQADVRPHVAERVRRQPVRLGAVHDALSRAERPAVEFVRATMYEIENLSRIDVVRRHFAALPACAFLLAWRVANPTLARSIVAFIRNSVISSLKLDTQVAAFREELTRTLQTMPDADRPALDEVLERAALDDERLAMRAALDAVRNEKNIDPALFAQVAAAIERDLSAGAGADAGRLVCRLLAPVASAGDEAMIGAVTQFCGAIRAQLDDQQRRIFFRRCDKIVGEAAPDSAEEILLLFGIRRGSLVKAKMTRLQASGDPIPRPLIAEAIEEVRTTAPRGESLALLGTLLAIAVREQNHELLDVVQELRARALPMVNEDQRETFRVTVYAQLEGGWREYGRHRRILESLGLRDSLSSMLAVADRHLQQREITDDLLLYVQFVAANLCVIKRYDSYLTRVLQRFLALSAHRAGGSASIAAMRFAAFALSLVPENVRHDCARHAYDALGNGAWPDVRRGEDDLRSLGLESEDHRLAERYLEEMMLGLRQLEPDGLHQSLALAVERMEDGNVGGAGYLLVRLLPLAASLGDVAFERQVHELVERLMGLASKFDRDGFRNSILRETLDAWPSRERAEQTLQQLCVSFGRIMRIVAEDGPINIDEVSAAIDACTKAIENDASEDVAAPLASILAAGFRCDDDTLRYRARQLLGRFLDAPMTRHEELDCFTGECRRLLESGAWGDADEAGRWIEELGIAPVRLRKLAEDPRLPVAKKDLDPGVGATHAILDGPWQRRAEDFLVHLLPLSARIGDAAVVDAVDHLVGRMLIRNPASRRSFSRRCAATLHAAWPNVNAGLERMQRLNIGMESDTRR